MVVLGPMGMFNTEAPVTLPWLALVGVALIGIAATYIDEWLHPERWR